MEALYDRTGQVIAFLYNSRVIAKGGNSVAWLDGNGNIYNYQGKYLGRWQDKHIRGPDGGVLAWLSGAKNLGIIPPIPAIAPIPPIPAIEPIRPIPEIPPIPPTPLLSWSSFRLI